MVGFQVDPHRNEHLVRLWNHLGIGLEYLPSGRASFTDEIVKVHINAPAVETVRKALKLSSLRSKYLLKYRKNVDANGILRYALHQLPAQKDLLSDWSEAGTVTGRFSSSEIVKGYGLNIQQEMKAAKQRVAFGFEEDDDSHDDEIYIIRTLRIPPRGRLWMAADAEQVEYRIFANYIRNPRILAQYAKDPHTHFHKYMWSLIKPFDPLTYRQQKDLNFAYIYGAGLAKQALMLGHLTKKEYEDIKRYKNWKSDKLDRTRRVRAIYERELPEVKPLLDRSMYVAKAYCDEDCYERGGTVFKSSHRAFEGEGLEHQGFVRTVLGRRSRFPNNARLHKAFNAVDQGGGADVMKTKICELHENRRDTDLTMRYTVHDEVDGDVPEDPRSAAKIREILDTQSFPEFKDVPILWEVSTGTNWKECA
jgi:hypothetical protein